MRRTNQVTRRMSIPEENVRIFAQATRREIRISAPCRTEGIRSNVHYK